jgi:hypothetical protein
MCLRHDGMAAQSVMTAGGLAGSLNHAIKQTIERDGFTYLKPSRSIGTAMMGS